MYYTLMSTDNTKAAILSIAKVLSQTQTLPSFISLQVRKMFPQNTELLLDLMKIALTYEPMSKSLILLDIKIKVESHKIASVRA